METKHTPLPWVRSPRTDEGFRIHTPQNMADAICDLDEWQSPATTEENSRFITRACNSYYDMLAVLQKFALEADYRGYDNPLDDEARAAIAKATK